MHRAITRQFVVDTRGRIIPVPRILKYLNLRVCFLPMFIFEKDVVVTTGIKWGIEVDQINAGIGDIFAEHR
jgi:hypothetical protein